MVPHAQLTSSKMKLIAHVLVHGVEIFAQVCMHKFLLTSESYMKIRQNDNIQRNKQLYLILTKTKHMLSSFEILCS
jgi:hypothetical protein